MAISYAEELGVYYFLLITTMTIYIEHGLRKRKTF